MPATFTVTNTNDAGAGSLRQAILDANADAVADTVVFDAAAFATPQTINLTSGQLSITNPVTITGPGAALATIKGAAAAAATNRIFNTSGAAAGTVVNISKLTLTGANVTGGGGAVFVSDENVTVDQSIVTGNTASTDGGAFYVDLAAAKFTLTNSSVTGNTATTQDGGALYVFGAATIVIRDSTVSGNTAGDQGGAAYFFSGGSLTVERSTVSGNTANSTAAAGAGGAVYFYGTPSAAGFTISNSTFSGNTAAKSFGGALNFRALGTANPPVIRNSTFTLNAAPDTTNGKGGGIAVTSGTGKVTLVSTIVAQNTVGVAGANPDVFTAVTGTPISADKSLLGSADGLTITGAGNQSGTNAAPLNAKLDVLASNGGPTKTHALLAGSPALNAGDNPAPILANDQRGVGFARAFGVTDVGAFEDQPPGIPFAASTPANVAAGGAASYSFTVTYSDPAGATVGIKTATVQNNAAAVGVTGPNGFTATIQFDGVTGTADGTPQTATYKFVPPGGTWDAADNGTYTVSVNANQVFDLDNKAVPAGNLATFKVAIPQTFTVLNTNDSGAGSLRQAVLDANAVAGTADTIVFDPAAFAAAKTINLTGGQMKITDPVTIIGPAAGVTIAGPGTLTTDNRVFLIDNAATGAIAVSLSNMTLTGGNPAAGNGGAMFVADESLTLTDVTITKNAAPGIGAGFLTNGPLTLVRVTVSDNTAAGNGGGIALGSSAPLTATRTKVTGNTAKELGGGLFVTGASAVTIADSTVSGNVTTGTGNFSGGGGMAFYLGGSLALTGSTVSGNTTAGKFGGGGIYFYGTASAAGVVITNSTISGNKATNATGGVGGGIAFDTFTGTALIRNSTVTNNESADGTNGGGGIARASTTGTVQLVSTVVAGNRSTAGKAPDAFMNGGGIKADFTFFGSAEGLTITGANNLATGTNAAPLDAKLGPLADNGGPTLTHASLGGSPLRNAGSNPALLATDQRGRNRVAEAVTDIGAFEYNPPTLTGITTAVASPTNLATIPYTVTFSDPVVGLSAANFTLAVTGSAAGTVGTPTTADGGLTWTVPATGVAGDGTIQLVLDNVGGVVPAVFGTFPQSGPVVTVDRVAPTATLTRLDPSPTGAASVSWQVVYSEPVTGVTTDSFVLVGPNAVGASVTGVTGSGTTYTVTAATGSTNDGALGLNTAAGAAAGTDAVGNAVAASTGETYVVDKIAPTLVGITRVGNALTNAAAVSWTVTFSEAVSGLTTTNFTFAAPGLPGAGNLQLSGSGATYTVTASTGTGDGDISLTLANGTGIVDVVNNTLATPTPVPGPAFTIDKTAPTVLLSFLGPTPTNADSVQWAVAFSEGVIGLVAGNFALTPAGLTGTSITNLTGSGASYVVTAATGAGDGTLQLDLANSTGLTDAAGNAVVLATGPAYAVDKVVPTATIAAVGGSPTPAASVSWTITFSEPVSGLDAADFALVPGGGVSGASITSVVGSGATYTVTADSGTGDGTLGLNLLAAAVTDAVGNPNPAADGPAYTIDKTNPTVAIARVGTELTNAGTVSWTLTFAEPVFGLSAANFALPTTGTVGGASITSLTGSGTSYTVVANTGTGDGTLGLTLANSTGLTDAAGNPVTPLPAVGPTYTLDKTLPTAVLALAAASPTNAASVSWTITFSEPVTGLSAGSFALAASGLAGSAITSLTGSGASYTLTATSGDGDGTLGLTLASAAGVADAATNPVAGVPVVGPAYTIGRTPPTVALSTPLADPTSVEFMPVTVTFSEAVTGFDVNDLSVTNGTVSAFTAVSGSVYTFTVTATAGGAIAVNVPAAAATDADGNASLAAPALTRQFVPRTPVPTLSTTSPARTNASVPVSVSFTEPMIGFSVADVQAVNAKVANFTALSTTQFTFNLVPFAEGNVSATIPAGAAKSIDFRVPNAAASLAAVQYDITAPVPTVSLGSGQANPGPGQPIVFTVTFSEPVADFPASAVQVTGSAPGTPVVAVSGTGPTYTVSVSGLLGDGTVTVGVPAGGVIDLAGNKSPVSVGTDDTVLYNDANPNRAAFPPAQFTIGNGTGNQIQVRNQSGAFQSETAAFDAGFTGGVRAFAADFNRDGIADLVIGTGPGVPTLVRVLDGATQQELFRVEPFEASFTGGVYVAAADMTGDGFPELVVTPDEGGGPRVKVYNGTDQETVADFFGIADTNFRGGARPATGDINGDGRADLIVAAGFGGGPRIAGFDGRSVGVGRPVRMFNDFFAFEQTLRNGVFVAAGDLDGDGFAELIVGGGPGGGPRVLAMSGNSLAKLGTQVPVADFFAGDPANRGGVRVAAVNLDDDSLADLAAGAGTGAGTKVVGYYGKGMVGGTVPTSGVDFDAFPGFSGGVFVG